MPTVYCFFSARTVLPNHRFSQGELKNNKKSGHSPLEIVVKYTPAVLDIDLGSVRQQLGLARMCAYTSSAINLNRTLASTEFAVIPPPLQVVSG